MFASSDRFLRQHSRIRYDLWRGFSPGQTAPMRHSSQKIPREVVVLGIVSFLTDVSSEAIFAVLPMYFVAVIGGSAAMLGIMEGLADFASSSLDMASGYAIDYAGRVIAHDELGRVGKSCEFFGARGAVKQF